jgi:hypothetical protein
VAFCVVGEFRGQYLAAMLVARSSRVWISVEWNFPNEFLVPAGRLLHNPEFTCRGKSLHITQDSFMFSYHLLFELASQMLISDSFYLLFIYYFLFLFLEV